MSKSNRQLIFVRIGSGLCRICYDYIHNKIQNVTNEPLSSIEPLNDSLVKVKEQEVIVKKIKYLNSLKFSD